MSTAEPSFGPSPETPGIIIRFEESEFELFGIHSEDWKIEGNLVGCPDRLFRKLAQLPFEKHLDHLGGLPCLWRQTGGRLNWSDGLILGMSQGRLVLQTSSSSETDHGHTIILEGPKCGGCGRSLGGRARCLICGWTRDKKLQEAAEAGKIRSERFRCGATIWPFIGSAVLLTVIAAWVGWARYRNGPPAGGERIVVWSMIGGLLLLGPGLTAVQILRYNLLWIRIDPVGGLETPGSGLIPWNAIASVERYAGALDYKNTLEGLTGDTPVANIYPFGCLNIAGLFVLFVVFPVISVLSPFHSRVTVVLKNGERIVLRDLEDSDRFTRTIRYKLEGHR